MMDLDPEARHVLALARAARTPSEEDKSRVERRLAIALGVGVSVGVGAGVAAAPAVVAAQSAGGMGAVKAAAGMLAAKWWLTGSALVVVALGSYVAIREPSVPPMHRQAKRAPVAHVAPSHHEQPVPLVVEQPAAPVEQPVQVAAEIAESKQEKPRGRHERRRVQRAPDPLAAEVELLHRAQGAWRAGKTAAAASLLKEHQRRFPRSELRLERSALQVLTLCEQGKKEQASRIARDLLARAPSSPLRASIEESCALR